MKKKSPNDLLNDSIQLLEAKRDLELIQLKQGFEEVRESLKPMNIIKETIKKVTFSSDVKEGLGKTAIGVASGFLIKNLLFRNTLNPAKLVARGVVQTAAVGLTASNLDKIKLKGAKILRSLLPGKKKLRSQTEDQD